MQQMAGTPARPDPAKPGREVPIQINIDGGSQDAEPQVVRDGEGPTPRRRMITETELKKYGCTDGCPTCEAKKRGEITRRGHGEACRRRIEGLMMQDAEDRKKLEKVRNRMEVVSV